MTTTKPLTRRQFYARMRKLGFTKGLQFARNGVSYSKRYPEHGEATVTVTVPKRHEEQFHIIGNVPFSGIFVLGPDAGGRAVAWGRPVNPAELGCRNMFEVCLDLCNGTLTFE